MASTKFIVISSGRSYRACWNTSDHFHSSKRCTSTLANRDKAPFTFDLGDLFCASLWLLSISLNKSYPYSLHLASSSNIFFSLKNSSCFNLLGARTSTMVVKRVETYLAHIHLFFTVNSIEQHQSASWLIIRPSLFPYEICKTNCLKNGLYLLLEDKLPKT